MLTDDLQGDIHKRQKKVMLPAFGMPEAKSFFPDFRNAIENVRWNSSTLYESVF
jgi:hypothetical protein